MKWLPANATDRHLIHQPRGTKGCLISHLTIVKKFHKQKKFNRRIFLPLDLLQVKIPKFKLQMSVNV